MGTLRDVLVLTERTLQRWTVSAAFTEKVRSIGRVPSGRPLWPALSRPLSTPCPARAPSGPRARGVLDATPRGRQFYFEEDIIGYLEDAVEAVEPELVPLAADGSTIVVRGIDALKPYGEYGRCRGGGGGGGGDAVARPGRPPLTDA